MIWSSTKFAKKVRLNSKLIDQQGSKSKEKANNDIIFKNHREDSEVFIDLSKVQKPVSHC